MFFLETLHRTGFLAINSFSIFSLLYSPMNFSLSMIRFSPVTSKTGDFLLTEGVIVTYQLQTFKGVPSSNRMIAELRSYWHLWDQRIWKCIYFSITKGPKYLDVFWGIIWLFWCRRLREWSLVIRCSWRRIAFLRLFWFGDVTWQPFDGWRKCMRGGLSRLKGHTPTWFHWSRPSW